MAKRQTQAKPGYDHDSNIMISSIRTLLHVIKALQCPMFPQTKAERYHRQMRDTYKQKLVTF